MSGGITVYNGNPGIGVDSTEVYRDNAWSFVGELPTAIWGMSATTLDNKVLLFGKIHIAYYKLIILIVFLITYIYITVSSSGGRDASDSNRIQEFSPETEEWSVIGAMEETRRHNRVSVVSFVNYKKWCN